MAEARAAGVLVAMPGDQLLTSDPDDIRRLAEHRNIPLTVVPV